MRFQQSAMVASLISQSIETSMQQKTDRPIDVITRFASVEHLSHTVPYDLAKQNYSIHESDKVAVFDADGKTRQYAVTQIKTSNSGLLCFVLRGLGDYKNNIHVVFPGTRDLPSLVSDIAPKAPGSIAYMQDEQLLVDAVADLLQKQELDSNAKFNITISGHSLGGAYTQYFASSLMKYMVQTFSNKYEAPILKQIGNITIQHKCSAGVTALVAAQAKMDAKYLAFEHGININLLAIRAGGDPVQQSGQANILADIDPKIVNVELLKIPSKFEGTFGYICATLPIMAVAPMLGGFAAIAFIGYCVKQSSQAHRTKHFNNFNAELNFEHLHNRNEGHREKITLKLQKKSAMLENASAYAGSVHGLASSMISTKMHHFDDNEYDFIDTAEFEDIEEAEYHLIDLAELEANGSTLVIDRSLTTLSVSECINKIRKDLDLKLMPAEQYQQSQQTTREQKRAEWLKKVKDEANSSPSLSQSSLSQENDSSAGILSSVYNMFSNILSFGSTTEHAPTTEQQRNIAHTVSAEAMLEFNRRKNQYRN